MHIAIVYKGFIWQGYGTALERHLNMAGFTTSIHAELPEASEIDVIFVIGIHEHPQISSISGSGLVGLQTEQLPCSRAKSIGRLRVNGYVAKDRIPYYDLVIEIHPGPYAKFHSSPNVRFFPYGCEPSPFSYNENLKSYDVTFIGKPDGWKGRRAKILNAITNRVKLYPRVDNLWSKSAITDAIHASKICLNLHYEDVDYFESPRFYDYLSTGACVLSERVEQSFPFQDGRDYLSFTGISQLIETMESLLPDQERRVQIATRGHKTATDYSFDRIMPMVLQEVLLLCERKRKPFSRFAAINSGRIPLQFWRFKQILAPYIRALRGRLKIRSQSQ